MQKYTCLFNNITQYLVNNYTILKITNTFLHMQEYFFKIVRCTIFSINTRIGINYQKKHSQYI